MKLIFVGNRFTSTQYAQILDTLLNETHQNYTFFVVLCLAQNINANLNEQT